MTEPSAPTAPRTDWVLYAVLVLDGAISALGGIFFLPTHLGSVPFPIAALLSALVNLWLVRTAWGLRARVGFAAGPLVAWALVVFAALANGPGGDSLLGSSIWTVALLVLGLGLPGWWLFAASLRAVVPGKK